MDSRLCPNCGSMIEPTDKFCPWCRFDLMLSRQRAENLNTGGELPFSSWGNDAQETGGGAVEPDKVQPAKAFEDFGQVAGVFPSFTSPPSQESFQETIYKSRPETPVQDSGAKQDAGPDDDVYQASGTLDQESWNNWMHTNIQWMEQLREASGNNKKVFRLSGFLSKTKKNK